MSAPSPPPGICTAPCRKFLAMKPDQFDAAYYRRYYLNPDTAVVTAAQKKSEVAFVLAFCGHIGVDVRRFADVGAGTGWWAKEFARQNPSCRLIETLDASSVAARRYGHRNARIEHLRGPRADLVICRDVLRYLPNAAAKQAIDRLADKCRGVLYLHLVTREDEVDEEASDMSGHFRSVRWYRRLLNRARFTDAGMGLFVSHRLTRFDPFALEVR